jgi:hypothetical protein
MNLVCTLALHFFEIYFNIILSCKPAFCRFFPLRLYLQNNKGKVKFCPLITGHEDPERKYRYNCTLSLTSALDEGGRSALLLGRFTSGKETVPII